MLTNHLFGPIKLCGFLLKDLGQAMHCWVKKLPDQGGSAAYRLVSL